MGHPHPRAVELPLRFSDMKLDEFFEVQQRAAVRLRGTVERLPDDSLRVRVTPWFPNVGCLCDQSITIPTSAIDDVRPTDDVHVCCGKRLVVVEIEFASGAQVNLSDVIAERFASGARETARTQSMPRTRSGALPPIPPRADRLPRGARRHHSARTGCEQALVICSWGCSNLPPGAHCWCDCDCDNKYLDCIGEEGPRFDCQLRCGGRGWG